MLKFIAGLIAVWTSIVIATSASAQNFDCSDPDNLPQQGMNYCAALDYEKADAELNAAWSQVKPYLDARDAEMPASYKGIPKALLSAQRGWIKYRDGHCETEGFAARGGTLEPLLISGCKTRLTRQRTKQLLQLLEEN